MKRIICIIFISVAINSGVAAHALAKDSEVKIQIFPLECSLDELETGSTTVTQLTPENCIPPDPEEPGGEDPDDGDDSSETPGTSQPGDANSDGVVTNQELLALQRDRFGQVYGGKIAISPEFLAEVPIVTGNDSSLRNPASTFGDDLVDPSGGHLRDGALTRALPLIFAAIIAAIALVLGVKMVIVCVATHPFFARFRRK